MDKWKKIKKRLGALSKKALIFIISAWIVITLITAHAFTRSQFIEQKFNKNMITQKTVFDYKTKELPFGINEAEGIIFPKTQNIIDVYIVTTVNAVEPVKVKGNYSVLLKTVAEGLWERAVTLEDKKYFDNEGETVEVINQKVSLDLGKILSDIDTISNEVIGYSPSKFFLSIVPVIEGDITYENNKIDLESGMVMTFELAQNQVVLTGEREYSKQTPVDEVNVLEYKINLFGMMVPVPVYRYVSLSVFLIYSGFALLILISKRQTGIEHMTEADQIERKYRNRLIPIQQPIDNKNKTVIPLESMKSLVRVSDEQDRGILEYHCDTEGKTFYYVIEDDYLYTYTIDINNMDINDNEEKAI
ncbi:MAG TPA: DUF5305 domain-containing protein [Clostridiaceae bacterium]|nr:DUF5305 domain-containing protein [Clostridiaceae bacterium]